MTAAAGADSAGAARSWVGAIPVHSPAPGLAPGPVRSPALDLDPALAPVRADRDRDNPDHRGKPSGTGSTGDRRTSTRYRGRNSSRRALRHLPARSAPPAIPDDISSSHSHPSPVNTGLRFSRKARTPSAKSAVAAQAANDSVSRRS